MPCRQTAAAIVLVLVLAACGDPKIVTPPTKPAATEPASEVSPKGPVRGIASTSGDLTTFRECGVPAIHAMTLTDPGGELQRAFASLSAAPSEGIYVELAGVRGTGGTTFAVTALLRARGLGEFVPCDAPVFDGEFVASGNEPFWAIEIRQVGIVYRSPEVPKGRTYPYAFTRTETDSVVYATKIESPAVSTLEVALEPGRCVDSMSGELRSFKAHVAIDGRKLEGCAAAGVPHGEFGNGPLDELNRFTGTNPRTVHLWKEPLIEKRLEALLGTNMPAFLEAMQVQSALMKDDGVFYVTGNKPHQGGSDSAFFLADPATDTVSVILFAHGARRDFKEAGREIALPADVGTMIGKLEKR
jgi:uncharacterized membrane protein